MTVSSSFQSGARATQRVGPGEPLCAEVFTGDQAPIARAWNAGLPGVALPLLGLGEDVWTQRTLDAATHPFTETWFSPLESVSTGLNEALGAVPLVDLTWTAGGPQTVRRGQWMPLWQGDYAGTEQGFVAQFNSPDGGMMYGQWTVDWERRAATQLNGGLTFERHENRFRWVEFGVFVNGVLAGRTGPLYPRRATACFDVVTPVGAGLVRCDLRMKAAFGFATISAGATAPSTNGNRPPIRVWSSSFVLRNRYR